MTDSNLAGGRGIFVGRDAELGLLLGGLDDARAGRGRFLALVGDAGIGKTRTLEEFVARAELPDERILWGRCPEHHGLPAYWPWTQAIGRYLEQCDAATLSRVLGRGAADLAQLLPVIGERLGGVEALPAFDPAQARLRLFDSIATLLRRIAQSHPLVLVLDDLHWADEGSILLLAFLVPELRRSRTLLLGTYRERQMRRLPRLAEVTRIGERVPLDGLALAEVDAFVRHASANAPPRDALVARLHHVTQGNPFFLDELLRMLRTSGGLTSDERELGALLPDEVRQVIRRNLEPLSADDRRLLTMASVVGYEFDVLRLGRLCELPSDDLLERLQPAVDAGVIEEITGASGRFRFAHMLIRETVYGDMPPLDRARMHRQVGLALEELHAGARDVPYAALARHFVHAAVLGDSAKALDYAARAGEQALARLAYEEAAAHLETALTVLRLERPDEARELGLRMSLGHAQTYAGDHHRARATFGRAAERARALGDAETFARAALGFSFAAPGIGAVNPTLIVLLEEALRLLGDAGDSALRATVLGCLGSSLYFSRDAERRDALSSEAVAMARRVGDAAALSRTLLQRHNVLWGPGSVSDRLVLCEEMIRLATESGDRPLELHGRLWRLVDLFDAGDVASLDVDLESFARESDHTRIPLYRWFAGVVRAARALLDGRLADSERLADEAVTLWQEGPLALPAQTRALQKLMIYLEAGPLGELRQPFEAMAEKYPAIPGWRSGVAIVLAESGHLEDARVLLEGFAVRSFADLPRDAHLLPSLASFALIAHRLHDVSCAQALYASLLPYAERNATVGFAAGTFGSCARYLGLLAATLGKLDDAVRHLDDALAANGRLASRPLLARTQVDQAHVLLLRHERPRAEALLAEARRTAEQLGLAHLLARIDASEQVRAPARSQAVSATFHREGAHWTLSFDGRTARVPHVKGNDYLALLLQSPGNEIHVLDLAAERPAETSMADFDPQVQVRRAAGGDAGEIIDAQARGAYQRRLAELGEELAEARSFNDLGRTDRLQEEIDSVTQELVRGIGLGGRHRKAASDAERARINVSRAITTAIRKIGQEHPALGDHLAAKVHTGTFCSYTPDPLLTVDWQF